MNSSRPSPDATYDRSYDGSCTPRRRARKPPVRSALRAVLVSIVTLSGCGYQLGSGDSATGLYRADVRTVAVPIFQTRSFSRGDEIALTQAIVNQIESRTPYKVVPREQADTLLEGTITNVSVGTISSDTNTAIPQDQLYTVTLDFTWKDQRTGKVLVERRSFEQASSYFPTLGEGRFVGRQSAVESLAAAIVDELQSDW